MKFRMKAAVAGLATAVLSMGVGAAAFASNGVWNGSQGWEPDPSARGNLVFYDSLGNIVTGGSLTASPPTAYVRTSAPPRAGDNTATLYGSLPQQGVATASWPTTQMSAGNTFPVASAPAPLNTSPDAVEAGQPGETSIQQLMTARPNTTGIYANLYQLRIKTSGTSGTDPQYWESDIMVNSAAGTWTQVFPAVQTTTGLQVSPASPQPQGTNLSLTATVVPASATGTVQFVADGSTNLGAPVAVSGGVATTTNNSLAVGSHQLTAVFTPGDSSSYATSTSPQVPYTIQAIVQNPTQVGLAVDPGSSQAFSPVTFTATVSPTAVAGTVTFSETPTGTVIGTTPAGSGTFVFQTSALGQGPHNVIATFNPTDSVHNSSSTSSPVAFTLGAPACTTCTDVQTIIATIPAGSLTITTPYTSSNPLNVGVLALNSSATYFTATATFANIQATDTRSGSLPFSIKALSSNMTVGANIINSQNIGLTNLVPAFVSGNGIQAGQVTTFNNPAATPPVAPSASGSQGLGGPTPHTIASVTSGPGSFSMNGTLTVNAPSSTPPGTYTGTITFTIG